MEPKMQFTRIETNLTRIKIEQKPCNLISDMFAGTRDKCLGCAKTVYPIEKVSVNGAAYHKSCFKCSYGGCTISPSNYIAHEGVLFCKHHHTQLIRNKGNLSQLESDSLRESAGFLPAFEVQPVQ